MINDTNVTLVVLKNHQRLPKTLTVTAVTVPQAPLDFLNHIYSGQSALANDVLTTPRHAIATRTQKQMMYLQHQDTQ
jgi:hypothetical protein